MATWTPSSPTLGPQQVVGNGGVYFVGDSLSQAAPYGAVRPCNSDAVFVRGLKFGALTADCSIDIWFAVDDAAANFGVSYNIPNAQLANVNGFAVRVPVAGKFWRAYLNAGTMTGANGVNLSGRY